MIIYLSSHLLTLSKRCHLQMPFTGEPSALPVAPCYLKSLGGPPGSAIVPSCILKNGETPEDYIIDKIRVKSYIGKKESNFPVGSRKGNAIETKFIANIHG
jgi:hypothetical protein